MTELRTDRLLLRRARPDDLAAIHEVMSNPQAMRYWSTPAHSAIGDTERWLAGMITADPATSDDFVIEEQGRVIGKLGCFRLPEIGFILAPERWGRGLASEALEAFLRRRRALATPRRLIADVDPRNGGSLGLLQRHGFRETHRAERTWHVGGEWCDSIYLALDF